MDIIYLNGDFMPKDQACISPLDRGFIFGDGIYEVIPVYNGHCFRLHEHLQRLEKNLGLVAIKTSFERNDWQALLLELIQRNGAGNQSIYLQISRGVADRDHAFPENSRPTIFAMSNPLKTIATEIHQQGISAITLEDIRWKYCHIKTISLLPNILLRQQALDAGATEAILIRDHQVTEGAASNLFIVQAGTILTPPKGPLLLPGITRDLVLELADKANIPYRETCIHEEELKTADEIWLTSSTKEILPVTQLDGKSIGSGKPGPLWQRMIAIYQDYKQHYQGPHPAQAGKHG